MLYIICIKTRNFTGTRSKRRGRRIGVLARLISTEASAVKAVSAAATAVPPAASMLF